VIDDEPDVLLLCRVNLQYAGHEVLEASNGERGVEIAVTAEPDVILLDVMLPERDGISILRELAEHPATTDVPVVLLTAKARVEDRLRGWRAGCSEYVTKPFSPAALGDLVDAVVAMPVEQRRRRREQAIEELAGSHRSTPAMAACGRGGD
jgi:two-component system alkaline phosphatase synthesis response regulator PhoP